MNPEQIIRQLEVNAAVFEKLFQGLSPEEYHWKASGDQWSILQIVCHLRDEEVEDFRTRVRYCLFHPPTLPPPIDPAAWVTDRKYDERDYDTALTDLLEERETSILWLHSLDRPDWSQTWDHPELGPKPALHYLANWLAHDYLHIRQVTRVKYDMLAASGTDLSYAGRWK